MVNETLIKVTAFSIVILLLLYYLDIWGKRRKRNKVRSYFFKHGYIPVNETDLKFKNFENNIIFDVSTPRIEIYHINAIIPHDQVFEFEIIPIGTRRYGSDNSYKETVKYLRELDISTTNAIHIQYIFSNQILDRLESFFKMDRWFNRPYFLDVKSNDGLLEVHVE
ncbi:MAG: hypothetical protein ACC656_15125, partial [Candidatus Heimdallarchaeota archaeon]